MKDETKKKLIMIFSGFLTGVAVAAFIVYKIMKHEQNKRDSLAVLQSDRPEKEKIVQAFQVAGDTLEEQAEALCSAVEDQQKEEIIYAFHKAFGLVRDITAPVDNTTGVRDERHSDTDSTGGT